MESGNYGKVCPQCSTIPGCQSWVPCYPSACCQEIVTKRKKKNSVCAVSFSLKSNCQNNEESLLMQGAVPPSPNLEWAIIDLYRSLKRKKEKKRKQHQVATGLFPNLLCFISENKLYEFYIKM